MIASRRRGVALFAALSLLALLGLLTVGAFASTTLSQRAERLHQDGDLLDAAADYSLTTVLASPTQFGLASLPLGVAQSFTVDVPQPDRVAATVAATRLPGGVLWLVADVNLTGAELGHRRVGLVARFAAIGPMPTSPFTARGRITLVDSVQVSSDTSGDADCRVRGPVSPTNQTADSSAYFVTAAQLSSLDSAASVRHVRGDTTISGGSFTGVLIADGNVIVSGPFSLDGLLIARGRVTAAGGLTVRGALMAFSADSAAVQITHAQVEYSPCAVSRALRTALPPRPVRGRSWSDLS